MNTRPRVDLEAMFPRWSKPSRLSGLIEALGYLLTPCRSWAVVAWAERLWFRYRPDITDLKRIYQALGVIDKATLELHYTAESRASLARQIEGWIIDGSRRPGLVLVDLAQKFWRAADDQRFAGRLVHHGKYSPFLPHPIPTNEPFLSLARVWPETEKERNRFLRLVVGQYPASPPEILEDVV